MPRSYRRTPDQQKAYRDAERKRQEDIEKRKAAAKAKAAAARPKKVAHTRSRWTTDY